MFGEQCFLMQIVRSKHSKYSAQIVDFFAVHRYNLIHGK